MVDPSTLGHARHEGEDRYFLSVVNAGTKEFHDLRLKPLMDEIPWQRLVDLYYTPAKKKKDCKRNNVLLNFGYTGGQCHEKRTDDHIRVHKGVATPAISRGTKDPVIIDLFVTATKAAKIMRVPWVVSNADPGTKERLDRYARKIDSRSDTEIGALAFLVILPGERVNKHFDNENCPELSDVIILSNEMTLPDGIRLRISLIATMRNSIRNAELRRNSNDGVVGKLTNYLLSIPRYRRPQATTQEHLTYGVGDNGLYIGVDKATGKVRSAALLTLAAMDRDAFGLSSLVFGLDTLCRQYPRVTLREAVGALVPLLFLCSHRALIHLLCSREMDTCWKNRGSFPGGITEAIFDAINTAEGGINYGPFRRCQNFTSDKTKPDVAIVAAITDWACNACRDSMDAATRSQGCSPLSPRVLEAKYKEHLVRIRSILTGKKASTKSISNHGLSAQIFLHVLVRAGLLLPPELSQFATVNDTKCSSVLMEADQTVASEEASATNLNKMGKLEILHNSVFLHFRSMYPSIDKSILENMFCECFRKTPPSEFFVPGQFQVHLEGSTLQRHTPTYDPMTDQFVILVREYTHPQVSLVQQAQTNINTGKIAIVKGGATSGTVEHHHLKVEDIGEATVHRAKKIFCSRPQEGETRHDTYQRMCNELARDPVVAAFLEDARRPPRTKHRIALSSLRESSPALFEDEQLHLKRQSWLDEPDPVLGSPEHVPPPPPPNLAPPPLESIQEDKDKKRKATTPPVPPCMPPLIQPQEADPREGSLFNEAFVVNWSNTASTEVVDVDNNCVALIEEIPRQSDDSQMQRCAKRYRKKHEGTDGQWMLPGAEPVERYRRLVAQGVSYPAMTLDWGPKNLERIGHITWCRQASPAGATMLEARKLSFPTKESLRHFASTEHKGMVGTGALLKHNKFFKNLPGGMLLAYAMEAINSMAFAAQCQDRSGPSRLTFSNQGKKRDQFFHHVSTRVGKNRQVCWVVPLIRSFPQLDYRKVAVCKLCDLVARSLEGKATVIEAIDDSRHVWCFSTKKLAEEYLCLCIILTAGSGAYYLDFHRKAHQEYRKMLTQQNVAARRSQLTDALPENQDTGLPNPSTSHEDDCFVIGFGGTDAQQECSGLAEPPKFYVIGRVRQDPKLPFPEYYSRLNDFCFALPDRRWYKSMIDSKRNDRKRPKESESQGLYVRPLRSATCLFVNEPSMI